VSYEKDRYWTDLHRKHPDELTAVGYPEMGRGFNEVTYRLRLAAAEEILRRASCSPRTLLEGGVGVGAYAALWQRLGVERWVGVDLSESAVERLKHRYPDGAFAEVDLASGKEALRAVIGDQRFDLVTAIDVLYHIVDESGFATALGTLGAAVTPEGSLLVSDVFVDQSRTIAAHVRRRSLDQYEEILAAHGLLLIDREPVFAVLGDPVPRPGFRGSELAMLATWRLLSKSVRSVPDNARESFGRMAAQLLLPLDRWLRDLGRARGVNLEFALFGRRRPHS
jgi:2-polyprenyl-3-methyl-5-hydroxy-6-metoxy-1,4-benzoquinol methylase